MIRISFAGDGPHIINSEISVPTPINRNPSIVIVIRPALEYFPFLIRKSRLPAILNVCTDIKGPEAGILGGPFCS